MKKALKIVGYLVVAAIIIVACLLSYVKIALPNVGDSEELSIDYTQERIARGEYLANHVTVCIDCHSTRDWTKFSGPPLAGTFGKGGERFDHSMGLPGVLFSKNITPYGISRYSDGELLRLITTGVSKEGKPMFPLMPYLYYGKMDKEDLYSIIAYVRSLSPIDYDAPETELDFPLNFIVHTIPQPATYATRPDTSDHIAYGAYMVNASGCIECHTQVKDGQIIPELAFGGGREFMFPNGAVVRSMNITPDQTGIGTWTEASFIARFKAYADSAYAAPAVNDGEFNSIMPWTMYAGMETSDLKAIYAYLKTVKPIENVVERWTPKN